MDGSAESRSDARPDWGGHSLFHLEGKVEAVRDMIELVMIEKNP